MCQGHVWCDVLLAGTFTRLSRLLAHAVVSTQMTMMSTMIDEHIVRHQHSLLHVIHASSPTVTNSKSTFTSPPARATTATTAAHVPGPCVVRSPPCWALPHALPPPSTCSRQWVSSPVYALYYHRVCPCLNEHYHPTLSPHWTVGPYVVYYMYVSCWTDLILRHTHLV
jgi:hypothetical protein